MRLRVCILFLLQFELVLTTRCYSCTGKVNNKNGIDPCLNPAENVGDGRVSEVDCMNTKLCWKATAGGTIKRGCAEKRCALLPEINFGSFASQTCCSNDLCNRTSFLIPSEWIVTFLLLFSLSFVNK